MPEGLVQVGPVNLVRFSGMQRPWRMSTRRYTSLYLTHNVHTEYFLATAHYALANVNKRSANTKFTTRVDDGGLRKSC